MNLFSCCALLQWNNALTRDISATYDRDMLGATKGRFARGYMGPNRADGPTSAALNPISVAKLADMKNMLASFISGNKVKFLSKR